MIGVTMLRRTDRNFDARSFKHDMRRRSYVSERYKLVYLETPKVASTSLKWALAHIEGFSVTPAVLRAGYKNEMSIHSREIHPLPALTDYPASRAQAILDDAKFKRFAAARNPYTRLIAAWSDKIRQIEPGNSETCVAISRFHQKDPQTHNPSFREFVSWMLETNDRENCNLHWRPQTDVIYAARIKYDYIIKTESIGADLQRIFDANPDTSSFNARGILAQYRYNESLPLSYEGLYDSELARDVAEFYAEDFRRFNYDPDSWKSINDRKAPTYAELEQAAVRAIQQRNQVIEKATMKTRKKVKLFLRRVYRKLIARDA